MNLKEIGFTMRSVPRLEGLERRIQFFVMIILLSITIRYFYYDNGKERTQSDWYGVGGMGGRKEVVVEC